MVRKRIKLSEVIAGLQEALREHQLAIGAGPDGTIYTARIWPLGCVIIDRKRATDRITFPVPEPAGVVWQPGSTDLASLTLQGVSEGLRRALQQGELDEGEIYRGKHCAKGVGPDGTKYWAVAYLDSKKRAEAPVFIEELPCRSRRYVYSEPSGVVWKPISAAERPVKREAVSARLRKALDGRGVAEGVAPDGMICRAELRGGLVFIQEVVPAGASDHRIAEPAGVVWRPRPTGYRAIDLEEASAALRSALKAARPWSGGRRYVTAIVGPDGPEYTASLYDNTVTIEQVIGETSRAVTMPEPEGVDWKPVLAEEEPEWVGIEDVSEGLRKALDEAGPRDGWGIVKGVGPDGMPYLVCLHHGCVEIYPDVSAPRVRIPVLEPEGAVWMPRGSPREPHKLEEVSEGLRKALQEALWPEGERIAAGVGADGKEYHAELYKRGVCIYRVIAGTRLDTILAEPEGVDWKPTLREKDWVKLSEVSKELREAMKEGDWGVAVGVGPDGTEYRAHVWHHRLVFIDFAGVELAADGTPAFRVPMPEPLGAAWKPFVNPHFRPRRQPWWQFWK